MDKIRNISNFKEDITERVDKAIEKRNEFERIENELNEFDKKYIEVIRFTQTSQDVFNHDIEDIYNIDTFNGVSYGYLNKDYTKDTKDEIIKKVNDICDDIINDEYEYFKEYFELVDTKKRTYVKTDYYKTFTYSWDTIYTSDVQYVFYRTLGILGDYEEFDLSVSSNLGWTRWINVNNRISVKFYKSGRLDIEFLNNSDKEIIRDIFK